jgi:hypothetical protein
MRLCLIFVAIGLASCAPQTQYIRADGRYVSPESIEGALADCGTESKDNLCMVEKGYFNVAAGQSEAKRAQLAAIAKANEQERQAKAKEKERQAKLAALAAERARKQALNKKKRQQTVRKPTPDGTIWSNPPTFMPVAPARR